jgi:ribosomal protein S18 acetylase RimI-like enzyme
VAGADVEIRPGSPADYDALVALFDEAVAWMVARGQEGQWGNRPFSERPETRRRVRELAAHEGLWIAQRDGEPVGALIVGSHPPHVEPIERSELYIELLISSRRHAGRGIGARLVRLARDIAIERGVDVLRVDCWAGAPTLVEWYERQGFTRSGMFDVDGWNGQVFEMPLQTCAK